MKLTTNYSGVIFFVFVIIFIISHDIQVKITSMKLITNLLGVFFVFGIIFKISDV
jgi:hypothetical protein